MSFDAKRIYELLPAIYRVRDAEQGGQLKALISILAEQGDVVQDNLAQMYDDLFIETCADWVVPYIGDLIGHTPLYGVTAKISSPRAEVANTIGYRRRKGTVAVLGQLARDVTGWPARVVEFFQLLSTTQHLNHLRPFNLQSPDLRDWKTAQYLDTGFDTVSHTAEMRRISTRKGRYNIPNIGIFVWRLRPYSVTEGTARRIVADGYTFDPLGMDIPLFNPSRAEEELSQLAQPINVPGPLQRRPLYYEVEAMRASGAAPLWFADPPVLAVYKNGTPIPPAEIMICDLSQWSLPPDIKFYNGVGMPIQVAVDPVLGRLTFPSNTTSPDTVITVDYNYGFSGDYGAGEYSRPDLAAPSASVHEIDSSETITGAQNIAVAADQSLTLQGADGKRPVIDGLVTIAAAPNSAVTLDGLLLGQGVVVTGEGPLTLTLKRCTVRPQTSGNPLAISWEATGGGLLLLDHTLSGSIASDPGVGIEVRHSLVDAGDDTTFAIAADAGGDPAGEITIVCSTVLGQISVRETVLVENSIITGLMNSQRTQSGCVRFSYLPLDSVVPRRYECQPNTAIDAAVAAALKDNPLLTQAEQDAIAQRVKTRVRPAFTAPDYGNPAYAQLDRSCPSEITLGAEDRSEMGVFHDLFQPWRESNLLYRLNEYLRIGLEAGILYVN